MEERENKGLEEEEEGEKVGEVRRWRRRRWKRRRRWWRRRRGR